MRHPTTAASREKDELLKGQGAEMRVLVTVHMPIDAGCWIEIQRAVGRYYANAELGPDGTILARETPK